MKILYFEKAASDLCLLGAFISALGILSGVPPWIFAVAIAAAALAYLIFCAVKKRWFPVYDSQRSQLVPVILAYSVLMAIAMSSHMTATFYTLSIPLFAAWFLLSMLVMQASRHANPSVLGLRFYLVNLLCLAAVLAFCWATSTQAFWAGVGWVLHMIWIALFKPVLIAVGLLAYWIIYGIVWVVMLILSGEQVREMPKDNPDLGLLDLENLFEGVETSGFPSWLRICLIVLGILIFLAITFLIIRRLAGSQTTRVQPSLATGKTTLLGGSKDKHSNREFPLSNRAKIRACWRRFQRLCAEVNLIHAKNALSAELADSFTAVWKDAPVKILRDIWLPARYSSARMTSADVRAAQMALREIQKAVRKGNTTTGSAT